jgi:hypothetical protein
MLSFQCKDCIFVLFLLAIPLSVLQFMASDNIYGITTVTYTLILYGMVYSSAISIKFSPFFLFNYHSTVGPHATHHFFLLNLSVSLSVIVTDNVLLYS